MNFYNIALGIANGNIEGLRFYGNSDYPRGKRVYLLSWENRSTISMRVPEDFKKEDWFCLPDYSKEGRNVKIEDSHAIAKFFDHLSRCQTIADLILATDGRVNNADTFKSSLEIIRLRVTLINLKNEYRDLVIQRTTRVINLCKEFLILKNGGILSKSPFLPLDGDGMIMPSIPSSHFNDENLLEWALSLSSEQKEKVLFFDFNHYPGLTPEIPLKIKQILPNLSFVCFGALPDSMCDVTLMGDLGLRDLRLEEAEVGIEREKEGKGKEKEVLSEETGEYYFPGQKRKSSSFIQKPCGPKRLKLDGVDSEKGGDKEKEVDSKENLKANQSFRPAGIKANRGILASSSEFFHQLFYGGFNEESQKEIVLKDVHPRILELTLDAFFLRTDLEGIELETLFEIYKTAFYLVLPSARALAEAQIIRRLEGSLEGEFVETESEKEKETEGDSGVEKGNAAEDIIQKLGQYYLDLNPIFSLEPESLLKKAIIKFLRNNLLSINSASYKELFVRFLEAKLPLVEIIKKLKVDASHYGKDLDNLYESLWQASLELQGQSFKEILSLCLKYWERVAYKSFNFALPLEQHLKCVEVCMNLNGSVEIKRILFASLLKAAQIGDDSNKRQRPLIGRKGQNGKEISDKFLAAATCLMKSIKGDFDVPKINTNIKEVFSQRLMELSKMALDPSELQIRARLASIAFKVNPSNSQACVLSFILRNPKWGIEEWESIVQPSSALHVLRLISPPEVREINTLDIYASYAEDSKNYMALCLCSVLYYYQEVQNWDKIFKTSYLTLKHSPYNELAHSLYGASLIQYAKVRPDQKEELLREAKQNLDQSLKFNPKNTIALTYLANWHFAKEEYKQAKDIFTTIKRPTLTADNLELINLLLVGTNEEVEAGLKILRRTLKHKKNQIMDLNWFHLMAVSALQKKDKHLLLRFKNFFEDCLDAKIYVPRTLSLLNWIYKEEALSGLIDEEKKKKLVEAMSSDAGGVNPPKFYRTILPPTRHPANNLSQEVIDVMLQILELDSKPSDLPDFDLEAYLLSIEDSAAGIKE